MRNKLAVLGLALALAASVCVAEDAVKQQKITRIMSPTEAEELALTVIWERNAELNRKAASIISQAQVRARLAANEHMVWDNDRHAFLIVAEVQVEPTTAPVASTTAPSQP